jgi:hypothetical protein
MLAAFLFARAGRALPQETRLPVDPRTAEILRRIVDQGLQPHDWNVQSILLGAGLAQLPLEDAPTARRLLWALHTARSHLDRITPFRPTWLSDEDRAWVDAVLDSIVARRGRPPHPDAVVEVFITSILPA